ncbi:hypothetical protein A9W97_12215 [Mycobacterium gordonae]|nr:hypothetical protein A9W97_12215 [Mycobacterium gordonae]
MGAYGPPAGGITQLRWARLAGSPLAERRTVTKAISTRYRRGRQGRHLCRILDVSRAREVFTVASHPKLVKRREL